MVLTSPQRLRADSRGVRDFQHELASLMLAADVMVAWGTGDGNASDREIWGELRPILFPAASPK